MTASSTSIHLEDCPWTRSPQSNRGRRTPAKVNSSSPEVPRPGGTPARSVNQEDNDSPTFLSPANCLPQSTRVHSPSKPRILPDAYQKFGHTTRVQGSSRKS
ncbi:UNVERIFIED_CONTAM: hypothetical protein Slati_0162100 [Sesamum latifolium]|uniref:Uncharacterized protein n=1 Tax=Sesamum latifolium TaxID=2727402 RepID=A0AAW2YAA5_9LAMI